GDRQVVIGARRFGAPLAGLERPEDDPKSQKTDARDKRADQQLLHEKGGNLAEFIKAKRAQGETRVANPEKATIGNVQVDMDSSQQLLPVYFGLTGSKEVNAYTAPLFTAIHHELGHAVNRLKGVHGRKTDRYTPDEGLLSGLTDEEELQNISLDRYSDKAFTDELNLSERIAHGAFTNLDAQERPFTEQDLKGALETWDKRTYKMDELRSGLLQKIRSVAFKDWTPFTFHGSAPAGVLKIQKALSPLQTSRKGIIGQLNQVQKLALSSHENPSSTRTKTTAEFYRVLASMRFDSPERLTAAGETLATAWSPFEVQEDPTPGLWTPGEAWRVHESRNDRTKLTEFPRYPTE
ncbi:MAG TPA: hypothetical protein VFY05_01835, partial [Candidatus Angelobacter sp.]|nr:hypothetical protein [Candidatus Angelobacter sp.]